MKTLTQQCVEKLRVAIVEGTLRPGQRLLMQDLRQRLGVGLSPIREALMHLERAGLVVAQSHKGFSVRNVSESDVRDLYKTVFAIEALALEQAIELGDSDWEADIARELYRLKTLETQYPVSYAEWSAANATFHRALVTGCGSPQLMEVRDRLWVQFDRICRLAFDLEKAPLTTNHAEHQQLAQAVLDRDQIHARALLSYHILSSLEEIVTCLKTGDFS